MKKQDEKEDIHQYKNRAGWSDSHHIRKPCSRGGETIDSNLLQLDRYRHTALHLFFKEKCLGEIIILLISFKNNKKEFLKSINNYHKHRAYYLLFKDKSLDEVVILLQRVNKIKIEQENSLLMLLQNISNIKINHKMRKRKIYFQAA